MYVRSILRPHTLTKKLSTSNFFFINHLVFTQTKRIDNCMGASIAHLAERSAVNRKVVGSSPTGSDSQDSVVVITSVLHAEGRGFNSHS